MDEYCEFLWRLLDTMEDGIYFADRERKITYWNRAAETLTGFGRNEVLGRHCGENFLRHIDRDGRSLCTGDCPLSRAMDGDISLEEDIFLHHRDGHRVPVHVTVFPVKDKQNRVIGAVETFRDRSARDLFRERIDQLATAGLIDPETDLPNRKYLERHLKTRSWMYRQFEAPFGIVYMKIDGFAAVKKNIGPDLMAGALRTVGRTFYRNMTPMDMVGRWEEDVFIGVVRDVDRDRLSRIADLYRILVAKTEMPRPGPDRSLTLSCAAILVDAGDDEHSLIEKAKLSLAGVEGTGDRTVVY